MASGYKIAGYNISLTTGDITEMTTDAIVNAANSHLLLGAGVAGAIRVKGGPGIQIECDKLGGCAVGSAVITGAGNLKAKYVIHAVGPQMGEGDEDIKLYNATKTALNLASANNLSSIALPAISTGIFGFPIQRCAEIMLKATLDFCKNEHATKEIVFCMYTDDAYRTFYNKMEELMSSSDETAYFRN